MLRYALLLAGLLVFGCGRVVAPSLSSDPGSGAGTGAGSASGGGGVHLEAAVAQGGLQHRAKVVLVVHEQESFTGHR